MVDVREVPFGTPENNAENVYTPTIEDKSNSIFVGKTSINVYKAKRQDNVLSETLFLYIYNIYVILIYFCI